MKNYLTEIFQDNNLVRRIKERLPYLFQLAEIESSRAGKVGMEVGSLRERIIVALLIYKFGEANVETEIPITKSGVDVFLFGQPISIKTITGRSLSGVKLIWTVDAQKAKEFREDYYPECDILLAQINWGNYGGFHYISKSTQQKVFTQIGRKKYIKLPKAGTNPRGVEITQESLAALINDKDTYSIKLHWQRTKIDYNPYKKWVDYWKEN